MDEVFGTHRAGVSAKALPIGYCPGSVHLGNPGSKQGPEGEEAMNDIHSTPIAERIDWLFDL